jgi:cyclase
MSDRRQFLNAAGINLVGLALLNSCAKKMNYTLLPTDTTLPYKIKHLRGKVGYFTERGGTIGWVTDGKETAVIDTQFPDQVANFHKELLKIAPSNITALINTHHHGDHTSGNIFFKDKVTKIYAHENSLKNQKITAEKMNNADKNLFPNTTFKTDYKLKVAGENIHMQYFGAGHTNGDIIVHFEDSNVMHVGDLLFNRRFPYIDKQGGANIRNWIKVHDDIMKLADKDTIIIAGHSNTGYDVISTKEDIKAFQNYLDKLLAFGEQCVKSGKTKEEVLKDLKVIPGAEEWTGDGISRSIDAVYIELTTPTNG